MDVIDYERPCVVPRFLKPRPTMPLFGKSHKTPADIVRTLKENLAILVKHDKKTDKVEKECVCVCLCVLETVMTARCQKMRGPGCSLF